MEQAPPDRKTIDRQLDGAGRKQYQQLPELAQIEEHGPA
jgi:hypothetical protein